MIFRVGLAKPASFHLGVKNTFKLLFQVGSINTEEALRECYDSRHGR